MKGKEICCSKNLCTGCYTCMNVCPVGAISLIPDKEGFVYPHVVQEKCIDCYLCQKRCPSNNPPRGLLEYVDTVIFKDNNAEHYQQATSGGAFGVLARYVIEQGGTVFGCTMEPDYQVRHIKVNTLEELVQFHGSKYVQSDIGLTYRDCRDELKSGKLVLFSGCPCQIDGLKHFLNKKYDNLITIDLICHGVPNQKFFNDFLHLFNKKNGIFQRYRFRYKYKSEEEKKEIYTAFGNDDFFIQFYVWGKSYRKACYNCRYAGTRRVGDFTLGDYWENFAVNIDIDKQASYSKILFNTIKSQQYVHLFKSQGFYRVLNEAEAKLSYRGPLKSPTPKNIRRTIIYALYRYLGIRSVAVFYNINKFLLKLR